MTDRYQLIKDLGLALVRVYHGTDTFYVHAEDLQRILEQAPEVFERRGESKWRPEAAPSLDSRRARLVCIGPAHKDTAEGLLREIIEVCNQRSFDQNAFQDVLSLIERAEKLLDGEEEKQYRETGI